MEIPKQRYIIAGPISTVILMIYNYFIIDILFKYIQHPLPLYQLLTLVIIIAALNIISITIEMNKSYKITRIMMELSEIWKWASLMYLIEIIFIYLIEFFIKIPLNIMYLIIILVPVLGIIGYYIAHSPYIREYDLFLDNKTNSNKNNEITIVQVSDLHIGSMHGQKLLKKLTIELNKINEQSLRNNDGKVMAIIAGDLADGSCPIKEDSFMPLKKSNVPIIFTPGNHDYYQGIENIEKAAKKAGIIILDNQNLNLEDYNFNIIGLSYSFDKSLYDIRRIPIEKNQNNLLIFHTPDAWDNFTKLGIDLQLSGHTHGGQFYPANLWVRLIYPYLKGVYSRKVRTNDNKIKNSYLSVSTGLGTMGPPIRLGTKSEIVVLHIKRIIQ